MLEALQVSGCLTTCFACFTCFTGACVASTFEARWKRCLLIAHVASAWLCYLLYLLYLLAALLALFALLALLLLAHRACGNSVPLQDSASVLLALLVQKAQIRTAEERLKPQFTCFSRMLLLALLAAVTRMLSLLAFAKSASSLCGGSSLSQFTCFTRMLLLALLVC